MQLGKDMGGSDMRMRMTFIASAVASMVVVAAPPSVAQTTAPKPLTPQQQRLRDCGAEWQKMKREGTANGLTWARLRRDCLQGK